MNQVNNKNLSWKLGINQFSDLTNEEYKDKYLFKGDLSAAFNGLVGNSNKNFFDDDDDDVNVKGSDINHSQWFLAPRDQKSCGSCWAFSTMGALEGNVNKVRNANPSTL